MSSNLLFRNTLNLIKTSSHLFFTFTLKHRKNKFFNDLSSKFRSNLVTCKLWKIWRLKRTTNNFRGRVRMLNMRNCVEIINSNYILTLWFINWVILSITVTKRLEVLRRLKLSILNIFFLRMISQLSALIWSRFNSGSNTSSFIYCIKCLLIRITALIKCSIVKGF
jgi:hypothetical protein